MQSGLYIIWVEIKLANRKTENDWTPEIVGRLWAWYGTNPYLENTYFSSMVGKGIINFLKETGKLKGSVLDYGCGRGHLLKHLLALDLECYAVDFSEESIEMLNEKFRGYQNWKQGTVISNLAILYPDNFFDVICCTEVLEHLSTVSLHAAFTELKRVLKPEGIVIITTPFTENLEQSMAYCPFCQSEFHKMQHFRSFTIDDMESLLKSEGFKVVFCKNIDFEIFQMSSELPSLLYLNFEKLFLWLKIRKIRLMDKLFPREFPQTREVEYKLNMGFGRHLCALATK